MGNYWRRFCHCIEYFLFILQWFLWIACYFWLIFIVIPKLASNYIINLLLTAFVGAMMFSLFRNLFFSFWESSSAFPVRDYQFAKSKSKKEPKRCVICKILKSENIHHCSTCDRCVYKLDHHCFCLGKCVSSHTYSYFISYVFVGWLTAILYFVLAIAFIKLYVSYPVSFILMLDYVCWSGYFFLIALNSFRNYRRIKLSIVVPYKVVDEWCEDDRLLAFFRSRDKEKIWGELT